MCPICHAKERGSPPKEHTVHQPPCSECLPSVFSVLVTGFIVLQQCCMAPAPFAPAATATRCNRNTLQSRQRWLQHASLARSTFTPCPPQLLNVYPWMLTQPTVQVCVDTSTCIEFGRHRVGWLKLWGLAEKWHQWRVGSVGTPPMDGMIDWF